MDVSEQLRTGLSDRYRIEGEVGEGGMATVYLAEDVRHHRKVALKVLRPELGAILGPDRFLSEINVTANLQHPHLLPLFDSGEVDGLLYYVMPYIAGETLRRRLERERQLPVEEAIRIATAVGSALDYAHRHNVIHRDLKPENILLHDGQPLVSDFGIALAVSNAGGARVTQTGLSLGTPQYMSPEQATGDRVIDARSDIYSLGAMLYEMLVGDPPHTAGTTQALIAKVLTERAPNVRAYRSTVPEHVDAAIQCALAKLPADRFATAAEFNDAVTGKTHITTSALDTVGHAAAATAAPRRAVRAQVLAPLVIAIAAVAVGALAVAPRAELERAATLFAIPVPDSADIVSPTGVTVALSPDGAQLAFVGRRRGNNALFVKRMDAEGVRELPGTEAALAPVFSPDGAWLLFRVNATLKKVLVTGGTPVTIADSGGTSSWGDDQNLYFSRGAAIWSMSSEGGPARSVAAPDTTLGHSAYRWPQVLPGSQALLFTLYREGLDLSHAYLGLMTTDGKVTDLGIPGFAPRYVNTGHIVFARPEGTLYAAPFSLRRRKITGQAVPVLERVMVRTGGAAEFTTADNGTIVYKSGSVALAGGGGRLVRVDLRGVARDLVHDSTVGFDFPRIDPTGRRIAVSRMASSGPDVWIHDLVAGTTSRVTRDSANERAEWTRDGQRIAFYTDRNTPSARIRWQYWDGSGAAEDLLDGNFSELSFGPPGKYNVMRKGLIVSGDIWIAPADSPKAARPLLVSDASENFPRVSPDGDLLAYVSNETGREEVYVRPLPGPGGRVQVSTNGGVEPVWSPDSRRLYYRARNTFMAAAIARTPELDVAGRDSLFPDTYLRNIARTSYDIFPNGQEFIFVRNPGTSQPDGRDLVRLLGVANWTDALRRRVRAP